MTDNKSFETVELFEPMSLLQIDGSNPFDVKDEAKAVQEPAKADSKPADDAVVVRGNTGVNTERDVNYNSDANYNTNYNTDTETSGAYSVEKIRLNPKDLIADNQDYDEEPESGEKHDYQKHNYAARFIIICVIVLCILFTLIMVKSFKDSDVGTGTVAESNYNPILVSHASDGSDVDSFIYTGGLGTIAAPDYTEMVFNADEIDADLPVIINPKCVEYTDAYYRILYFTATATEDDVSLMMSVQMFDSHDRQICASTSSNFDIKAGDEFMIPVVLDIPSDQELGGITYKIKADTYKAGELTLQRKITDVTEAEKGHFLVTYEGTPFSGISTYIALYKNGEVVGILNGVGEIDETGKVLIDVYKTEIDYDTYKVFY